MVMPPDIEKRLSAIRNLPTLPKVIENLGQALRDPDVQASRIAEIIEDDPAIMTRIMKIVNSSFYLGNEKATSLKSAIVRLGFQAVSNIAMSAAVFSTFPPGGKAKFDRAEFWRHCICTGIAADVGARRLPEVSGADAFASRDGLHLCGLLHDIGKIIFEQYFHDRFVTALAASREEKIELSEAEKRVIGIDHGQVGAWLAKKWKLSPHLTVVIRWHQDPENAPGEYRKLVRIIRLADRVANAGRLGDGGNGCVPEITDVAREFDLDEQFLVQMVDSVRVEAEKSTLLMSFLK